jgi:hypothetical protein
MKLNNESLIKASVIFGGGFLAFLLLRPKWSKMSTPKETKAFDSAPPPPSEKDLENAEIVAKAYADALKAGEPPAKLTELNSECMKDFGMRCYIEKSGKLIVSDVKGNTILSK